MYSAACQTQNPMGRNLKSRTGVQQDIDLHSANQDCLRQVHKTRLPRALRWSTAAASRTALQLHWRQFTACWAGHPKQGSQPPVGDFNHSLCIMDQVARSGSVVGRRCIFAGDSVGTTPVLRPGIRPTGRSTSAKNLQRSLQFLNTDPSMMWW